MTLPFAGRLLAVAMLAPLATAVPFSHAHADTAKPKVALVMKSLANEFFRTMEDGAKAYQKEHPNDFDLVANGIKDESDTSNQIRIVEQMIATGANALVIAPADSKALVPVSKYAQQRTAGFQDAMQAAQIKVVSVQSGNWEIDKGNAVAAAMLNEYPEIKALLAGNDSMALGAVSAVRAAGKKDQVQVVGYDNINAIKPMLKDGRVLATLDQDAKKQAVYGIQAALQMIKGEKTAVDADNVIQTPVELITKP